MTKTSAALGEGADCIFEEQDAHLVCSNDKAVGMSVTLSVVILHHGCNED
jgi:hypothetical protein